MFVFELLVGCCLIGCLGVSSGGVGGLSFEVYVVCFVFCFCFFDWCLIGGCGFFGFVGVGLKWLLFIL